MTEDSQLLKVIKKDPHNDCDEVTSSTFKGISFSSSSWIDGSRPSAFHPYRPSKCPTILTNLQRGNTEAKNLKHDCNKFSWHQKAGRGDITSVDIDCEQLVDELDSKGLTALMWASSFGQYSVVKLLIEAGANVNAEGPKMETSLLLASAEGHLDIVKILLKNGAKVNHTDKDGSTALLYASFGDHHHCVHELLLNHADMSIKNYSGISCYRVAVSKNNRLVKSVFENYLLSLIEGDTILPSDLST